MARRLRRVLRALPGMRSQPAQRGGQASTGVRGPDSATHAFPDAPDPVPATHRHLVSGALGFVLGGLAVWGYGISPGHRRPSRPWRRRRLPGEPPQSRSGHTPYMPPTPPGYHSRP